MKFGVKLLILVSLSFSSFSYADSVSDIPGLIPLNNQHPPASDLVYNGKEIDTTEARQLQKTGVDISTLNPIETSILWKSKPTQDLTTPEKNSELNLASPVDFVAYNPERVGRMGFTITQNSSTGLRIYRVRLEPSVRNNILRKNLLRKLGYNIPTVIQAPKITINFKDNYSRDEFSEMLEKATLLDPTRWVSEKREKQIVVQDAVVFEGADDVFYNLALGDMVQERILNRRIINSLLVPYNLVDVTESVNIFGWTPGRIFNKQLSLPYDDAMEFTTSFEDARWIARKILSLTREDFVEIVKNANYPPDVEEVIIEKLLSRRNFLRKYLALEKESQELQVNTNVAKIEKDVRDGHVQRYAYGDPESPLTGEDLFAFFKSKVTSNIITNLVTEFSTRYIPRTDIGWEIFDHQLDLSAQQFAEFIRTGKIEKTPFGFWTFPVFGGSLIANREVITGSYLGTDNLVQLADVVGASVEAGWEIRADGLPTKVGFQGSAKAFGTRTYAHVKPIKSIKLALKEPFRNIMVPNYKGNIGTRLERLFKEEYTKLSEEERQKELDTLVTDLKNGLGKGESIIVSTTVGAGLNLSPSLGLTSRLALITAWSGSQNLLSRIHIYRSDENTIQIYKDPAHMNSKSFYAGLHAYIPFLSFRHTKKEGRARTDFYSININSKLDENPEIEDNLKALSRAFLYSKLDMLKRLQDPYVIQHKFKEKLSEGNFFFLRSTKQKTQDEITVKHPTGFEKDYVRYTVGKRKGKNYEALAVDVINSLLTEYSEEDIMIQSSNGGDPADSVYGNSISQHFTFESEITPDNQIKDPFISLSYRWRNWSIGKEKILDLIMDINDKFKYQFFHPSEFQSTEKVQLSTFSVSANIYEPGIAYLLTYTKEQIGAILKAHGYYPYYRRAAGKPGSLTSTASQREKEKSARYYRLCLKMFENFKNAYQAGNVEDSIKYLSQFTTFAEKLLPVEDFYKLFGGEQNIFVRSQVFGFRVGDERQDGIMESNTLGELGSDKGSGPLKKIQNQIGVTESEFFIYWLMNRI